MVRRLRTGTSVASRLRVLEHRMPIRETTAERQSRAVLTRWLAESDDAAELWLDYHEALEATGSPQAMLASPEGRAAISAVAADLFVYSES